MTTAQTPFDAAAQTPFETRVTINKAYETDGRNGKQWELLTTWPWTIGDHQDKTWLEQVKWPKCPKPGTYSCTVYRRSKKKRHEGGYHDGSREWMWNMAILAFGGSGEGEMPPLPPSQNGSQSSPNDQGGPSGTQGGGNTGGEYWGANNGAGNMAFEAAVALSSADVFNSDADLLETVLRRRHLLYHKVILVPIEPDTGLLGSATNAEDPGYDGPADEDPTANQPF
jgi:hypothetical protein